MKVLHIAVLTLVMGLVACSDKDDGTQVSKSAAQTQGASGLPSEQLASAEPLVQDTTEAVRAAGAGVAQKAREAGTTVGEAVAPVVEAGAEALAGAVSEGQQAVADAQTALQSASEVDTKQGKEVYTRHCVACHGTGAAGAPKLKDAANWGPRIAQGMDTLTTHALKGFQGNSGYMPPKGGFAALGDDEVKAAVAYMVAESR